MTAPRYLSIERVTRSFGDVTALDAVDLGIAEGEFVSILGPSGCGKTTLLRIIAGLEHPDQGRILIDGEDVTSLSPERRPTNLVFQRGALFPHMTVAENVGYALRRRRVAKDQIDLRVDELLELVGLEALGQRRPSEISGGQAQRVALARAICGEPKILLLDEPLSALDLKLRQRLQLELRALHRRLGTTFVFVTHDQEESLTLSDRVVVLNHGRVAQIGTPHQIYRDPADAFVSAFIGETNLLEAQRASSGTAKVAGVVLTVHDPLPETGPFTLSIRPESVQVAPVGVTGANRIVGRVVDTVYLGSRVRIRVDSPLGREIWIEVASDVPDCSRDQPIEFELPPEHLRALPMVSQPNDISELSTVAQALGP